MGDQSPRARHTPRKETGPFEERRRFIESCRDSDESFAAIGMRFGISRQKGYKWLARFEEGGLEGLVDRSRRPHSNSRAVSPAVVELIVEPAARIRLLQTRIQLRAAPRSTWSGRAGEALPPSLRSYPRNLEDPTYPRHFTIQRAYPNGVTRYAFLKAMSHAETHLRSLPRSPSPSWQRLSKAVTHVSGLMSRVSSLAPGKFGAGARRREGRTRWVSNRHEDAASNETGPIIVKDVGACLSRGPEIWAANGITFWSRTQRPPIGNSLRDACLFSAFEITDLGERAMHDTACCALRSFARHLSGSTAIQLQSAR
jgi:transposase-like protein